MYLSKKYNKIYVHIYTCPLCWHYLCGDSLFNDQVFNTNKQKKKQTNNDSTVNNNRF